MAHCPITGKDQTSHRRRHTILLLLGRYWFVFVVTISFVLSGTKKKSSHVRCMPWRIRILDNATDAVAAAAEDSVKSVLHFSLGA